MTSAIETEPVTASERTGRDLHEATRAFAQESVAMSWWHVGSTFTMLALILGLALVSPWWPMRLAASICAALVMVRAFILYHDFMHGAILSRSGLARVIFYVYSAFSLTPPRSWRASHNFHHANVGKIEGSDVGSFPVMTARMWQEASAVERLRYRLTRHPLTILLSYVTVFITSVCLMPLLRSPTKNWDSALSLLVHGSALAGIWWFAGFHSAFYAVLLPMTIASALGGYLFYAQHSFPGLRILPVKEWTHYRAALVSSSYLRTGPVLRWTTGNIGYHHVHHLNSLIPFYRLPQAMDAIPELQSPPVTSLHPRDVVACFRSALFDESSGRMVSYRGVPVSR